MRHRALLFGIVGGLLVAAAFQPRLKGVGDVVGFASMLSFLVLAWLVGDYYGAGIRRVAALDGVGIAALAGAALVDAVWLRPRADQPIAA